MCEKVFRPLAHPLVLLFARLRVPPPAVVVAAGVAGVAAAVELGRGSLLANLGMSTQLAAFGLLIAVGHPLAFAWVAVAEVAVIALALLSRRAPSRQEEIA